MSDDTNKINLNKIPVSWIEVSKDGQVIIKNPEFAEQVKASLSQRSPGVKTNNGGCGCISG